MSHSAPLEDRTLCFYPLGGSRKAVEGCNTLRLDISTKTGDGEHQSPPEPVGPSHSGVWGQSPQGYPESIAQSYKSVNRPWELGLQGHFLAPPAESGDGDGESWEISRGGDPAGVQLELVCPSWGVVGECEQGHHYAKELICNREWCRFCGGNQGKAHQRRKAAWLPRAMQLRQVGYFVMTIPPELRPEFRRPEVIRGFGKAVKRVMKYHGFARGLRRWHWFGEDHPGQGLQGDGLPVFHPHLNILVDAGWLPFAKLEAIRRSVSKVLGVDLARVNVHYEYARSTAQKLHMVKYVLRPTFEHWEWDQEMAYKLLGFRNALHWGTWKDQPAWVIPAGDSEVLEVGPLERGRCPVDGTPITWGGLIAANLLLGPWWVDIGGGYRSWTGLARDGP